MEDHSKIPETHPKILQNHRRLLEAFVHRVGFGWQVVGSRWPRLLRSNLPLQIIDARLATPHSLVASSGISRNEAIASPSVQIVALCEDHMTQSMHKHFIPLKIVTTGEY
jgi:hypothetical protein